MTNNLLQFMFYIKIVTRTVNLYVLAKSTFFLYVKARIYMYGCTSLLHEEIDLVNTCKPPAHLNFPYESSTNKT